MNEDTARLFKRVLDATFEGAIESAGIADTLIRVASHEAFGCMNVRPGFIPMSKSPDKNGFTPVQYVDSPIKLGAAAAKRRRRNPTVRAHGLHKQSDHGAPCSDGKMRDHKARKGNRARSYVAWFISNLDVRMNYFRNALIAAKIRDEMSLILSHPDVRVLFTSKERRKIRDTMKQSAFIVRRAHAMGVL